MDRTAPVALCEEKAGPDLEAEGISHQIQMLIIEELEEEIKEKKRRLAVLKG